MTRILKIRVIQKTFKGFNKNPVTEVQREINLTRKSLSLKVSIMNKVNILNELDWYHFVSPLFISVVVFKENSTQSMNLTWTRPSGTKSKIISSKEWWV